MHAKGKLVDGGFVRVEGELGFDADAGCADALECQWTEDGGGLDADDEAGVGAFGAGPTTTDIAAFVIEDADLANAEFARTELLDRGGRGIAGKKPGRTSRMKMAALATGMSAAVRIPSQRLSMGETVG